MTDDTISRAAALNCVYGTSPNKIKGRIAELPPAQPGWIPCTPETMPQESGEYLVTVKWGEDDCDTDIYEYSAYGNEWNDGELFGGKVIAWQPKPQPWEGGQDNGKT